MWAKNRNSQERTSNETLHSHIPSQAGGEKGRTEQRASVKMKPAIMRVKVISAGSKVVCCLAFSDEVGMMFGAELLRPVGSGHEFALNASPLCAGPSQKPRWPRRWPLTSPRRQTWPWDGKVTDVFRQGDVNWKEVTSVPGPLTPSLIRHWCIFILLLSAPSAA